MQTQTSQILDCLQPLPGVGELGLSHKLLCIALMGSDANDYEVRKHRQALTEGVDWLSANVGNNNTPRILYSVSGIRRLIGLMSQSQYAGRCQQFLMELDHRVPPLQPPAPGGTLAVQAPVLPVHNPGYAPAAPQYAAYGQPQQSHPEPAIAAMQRYVTNPIVQAVQQTRQADPMDMQERLTELQIRSLEAHVSAFCRVADTVRGQQAAQPTSAPPALQLTPQESPPPLLKPTADPFKLGLAGILAALLIAGFGWEVIKAISPNSSRSYSEYSR